MKRSNKNDHFDIHAVHGVHMGDEPLKKIENNFFDGYLKAVSANLNRVFIRVYALDGTKHEKTFGEFSRDVENVRKRIANLARGAEILVTLSKNTYENAVYIVAGFLEGLIVCPLNSEDSKERNELRLKSLDKKFLLVSSDLGWVKFLNAHEMSIKVTDEDFTIAGASDKSKDPLKDFCYIFTSGSTGESKIVRQLQINVLANVADLIFHHDLGITSKIATPLPIYHVNCLHFSFLSSLLSGAEFTLYQNFNAELIVNSTSRDAIQILSLVPPLLRALLPYRESILKSASNLKYVVSAATSLPKEIVDEWGTSPKIIQGYGLSEAVNFSALMPISLSPQRHKYWMTQYEVPSIGVELRSNEIHILDESECTVEQGQVGNICIRGWNVMRGYLNFPDLENNERYLKTGDRGFFKVCEESGQKYFFILGRTKDICKKNGETIGLREVDQWIQKFLPRSCIGISIPFENLWSGEEIGCVVFNPRSVDLGEFVSNLENNKSLLNPKVISVISQSPLTESGKPKRWAFKNLFLKFQAKRLAGSKILVLSSFDV